MDNALAKTEAQRRSLPVVLAMTGASGSIYAVRLLQQLLLAEQSVHLVCSPSAGIVMRQELNIELDPHRDLSPVLRFRWPTHEERWGVCPGEAHRRETGQLSVHSYQDFMAPIASGSYLTRGMVICPCTGATLSGVVHAAGNNLIHRAADVHLKEHRKLIVVPRETPLSSFQLENMHRASQAGAIVLPAMPGWYHGVETIVDLIDFVVARILDHLEVPHGLMRRWGEEG